MSLVRLLGADGGPLPLGFIPSSAPTCFSAGTICCSALDMDAAGRVIVCTAAGCRRVLLALARGAKTARRSSSTRKEAYRRERLLFGIAIVSAVGLVWCLLPA